MAPLATNNSSNGSSSNGAGSGMPHSVITGIIIALRESLHPSPA